jgi:hypothetical protein
MGFVTGDLRKIIEIAASRFRSPGTAVRGRPGAGNKWARFEMQRGGRVSSSSSVACLVDRLVVTTLAAVSTRVVSTGLAVVAVKVVVANVVVVVVVEAVTTEVHAAVGTATVVAGVVVAHAVGTHAVVTVVVGGFVHRHVGDDHRVAGVTQAPATAMDVSESVTTLVSAMRVGSGPTTTASTTPSSTFSTLCESLRINCQGQGDCEHSDEGDFA